MEVAGAPIEESAELAIGRWECTNSPTSASEAAIRVAHRSHSKRRRGSLTVALAGSVLASEHA
jgi:hypothetical protein